MTLTIMRKAAAVTAAAVLALGLTACGSDSGSDDARDADQSSEEETTAAADDEATSEEESEEESSDGGTDGAGGSSDSEDPFADLGDIKAGGSFSGTVDGEPVEIDDVGVVCTARDDSGMLIGATSAKATTESESYPRATVLLDGSGNVSLVSVARSEDDALTYMTNVTQGSAEATVDGSTYTITGEAIRAADMDPSSSTPFELTFTCP